MDRWDEPDWQIVVQGPDDPLVEDVGRALKFEEARKAAELYGIIQDLEYVVRTCDDLEARLQQAEHKNRGVGRSLVGIEEDECRSLWIAARVTYARCFLKGIRHSLSHKLFECIDGQDWTKRHQYYMDIRDKHIAHSVNPLEAYEA